ncbi:FISUMP domain-containing protein [Fibrobacter succinogenes]|uniref:FISUMP domain-containing protein n=1 Tax=Fibrobacter succinogenes TaxID=833 RepID=UPI001569083C|nr:FISUMP domain-containing protein [Fibrobacter succinogenes]
MNKKILTLALSSFLFVACGESSNASDSFNANSVEAGNSSSSEKDLVLDDSVLLECEKSLPSPFGDDLTKSQKTSKDTVCFYEDFVVKDTICCFGEVGTYLLKGENGKFINVSSDFGIAFKYDTLFASIEPSTVHRCMATVGNERYRAVKIGSQTWLSENAGGEGRCLNDDDENCKLFGSLKPYDEAEKICSGDYRLPTSVDVEKLMQSVGAKVEISYTRDICGEIPSETRYYDVPLFVDTQDSSKNDNIYEFSFKVEGGTYDHNFEGKQAYLTDKTCFFLQSDEKNNFRMAFCYDVKKKYAVVTEIAKDAEVYVRCIMK